MKWVRIVVFILLAAAVIFFIVLRTSTGSRVLVTRALSSYVGSETALYESLQGSLSSGITIDNLELHHIQNLPEGSVLKIQNMYSHIDGFSLAGITMRVENARLILPDSDPIMLNGTFEKGLLNFNIYSNGVTVSEILSYVPDFKYLVPVKGEVNQIDLYVTGDYLEPTVTGSFAADHFMYKGFLLNKAVMRVDLQLKETRQQVKLFGNIYLDQGEFRTKKVLINMEPSRLTFSGPLDNPDMRIFGRSKVERTKIQIQLRGNKDKPDLSLSSEPSFSKQKLMVMLATGKSWQSVEDSFDQGLNSAALTRDFIDYFFFAGKSNQFAERFGISEFSVTYDGQQRGVSARKEVTENLEVGYGIHQTVDTLDRKGVTQKLEGEYQVNDRVTVGVEREMKQRTSLDGLIDESAENNDKVLIKYKKQF